MGLIKPDFSQVQDHVEPGTYRARIVDAKIDEWPGKNGKPATPYINWRMETFQETEVKNNGRSIFMKTPITGKGAFRLRDLYRAATGEALDSEFDTEQLMSKEVELVIVDGKDAEGNPSGYTDVKAVKPIRN